MSIALRDLTARGLPDYDDVGLQTVEEPQDKELRARADGENLGQLDSLKRIYRKACEASEAYVRQHGRSDPTLQAQAYAATKAYNDFRDGLLAQFPALSATVSRSTVDVSPPDNILHLQTMIASSAMRSLIHPGNGHYGDLTALNGGGDYRFAEALARYGGLPVIPHDVAIADAARLLDHLRGCHPLYHTALRIRRDTRVEIARRLLWGEMEDSAALIVDDGGQLKGIVTLTDLESGSKDDIVWDYCRQKDAQAVSANEGITAEQALDRLDQQRDSSVLPIIAASGEAKWILTRTQAALTRLLPPSIHPDGHGFGAMFAVGISDDSDTDKRIAELMAHGATSFILETAHAYRQDVFARISGIVRGARRAHPAAVIAVGTQISQEAVRRLRCYEVNIAKAGIGAGGHCLTTDVTGLEMPAWWATRSLGEAAAAVGGIQVMGDGGVNSTSRVNKMLSNSGVGLAQIGTWFMPLRESAAAHRVDEQGRRYKSGEGMASAPAVLYRRQQKGGMDRLESIVGVHSEGRSGTKLYPEEEFDCVGLLMLRIKRALQSQATYADATNMREFQERSRVDLLATRRGNNGGSNGYHPC